MTLFFISFIAIYGSVHVYAFFRTRGALGLGAAGIARDKPRRYRIPA